MEGDEPLIVDVCNLDRITGDPGCNRATTTLQGSFFDVNFSLEPLTKRATQLSLSMCLSSWGARDGGNRRQNGCKTGGFNMAVLVSTTGDDPNSLRLRRIGSCDTLSISNRREGKQTCRAMRSMTEPDMIP